MPEDGARVGPGHDHHVGIGSRVDRGLYFAHHFIFRDDLTAVICPHFFVHYLIFELDNSDAGLLIFAKGAPDVYCLPKPVSASAMTGMPQASTIAAARATSPTRQKPHVGAPQMTGRLAVSRHVHRVESRVRVILAVRASCAPGATISFFCPKSCLIFVVFFIFTFRSALSAAA
jgi:hypothetical protein